jgi:hypothetical protein
LSPGRFSTTAWLNELDTSAAFSRNGSFESAGSADGETSEEGFSIFVLVEEGEESAAAYELFF